MSKIIIQIDDNCGTFDASVEADAWNMPDVIEKLVIPVLREAGFAEDSINQCLVRTR